MLWFNYYESGCKRTGSRKQHRVSSEQLSKDRPRQKQGAMWSVEKSRKNSNIKMEVGAHNQGKFRSERCGKVRLWARD